MTKHLATANTATRGVQTCLENSKISFRQAIRPTPSSRRSPDLLVGCGEGIPFPILHSLDAFGVLIATSATSATNLVSPFSDQSYAAA